MKLVVSRIGLAQIVASSFTLVVAPTVTLAAEPDTTTFLECQSIQDDESRLACYDKMASPQSRPSADAVTAPADAVTAPADAVTAPADAVTAPAEAVTAPAEAVTAPVEAVTAPVEAVTAPVEAVTAPAEAVTAPEKAVTPPVDATATTASSTAPEQEVLDDDIGRETLGPKEGEKELAVRGRVVSCQVGRSGKYVFYFNNGQIWKQKGNMRVPWQDCDFEVTIGKDIFGYTMLRDGEKRLIRISRAK